MKFTFISVHLNGVLIYAIQVASAKMYNMKMPKAPDRPLVPYMRYSRKMWPKVRAENPDAQLWDISRIIGQMWKEVPENEKVVYQHEFEIEKIEHEKAMKAYQNSASYQQFMAQKNAMSGGPNRGPPPKMSRSKMDLGGVVIQQVDEDSQNEMFNELTARRLAATRFDRNHRLVAELLNPAIVTDTRMVVAQNRIEMLKKQASSLVSHQKKLEEELIKLEEAHRDKRKAMETASEQFGENLKKVCEEKVVVEAPKYDAMVEEWTDKLASAYDAYKKKQEAIDKELIAEREKLAKKTPLLYNLTVGEDDGKMEEEPPAKVSPAQKAQEKTPTPEKNKKKTPTKEATKANGKHEEREAVIENPDVPKANGHHEEANGTKEDEPMDSDDSTSNEDKKNEKGEKMEEDSDTPAKIKHPAVEATVEMAPAAEQA